MVDTLTEKAYKEKWSTDQIATEMLKHGPNSPEHKMFRELLHMRQQESLIHKTWLLVIATWALVVIDVLISLLAKL